MSKLTCAGHQGDAEKLPYIAWHHRSEEARKHGERQQRCSECGRYYWSWELQQSQSARKSER